ncbi:hypothetical protein [Campylobacter sp. 7477a]|uniref:hypothetical protein n=1 Tax=Campylobacter sp. 7477a TaxID=2735741 RepID=UPI003014EC7B|nr:hypothetical protein [Campylobacter sp. 7477a]
MKTKQIDDDDILSWLVPLSAIVGASAYGLFDINPFYFIFAVPFVYPFLCEFLDKN